LRQLPVWRGIEVDRERVDFVAIHRERLGDIAHERRLAARLLNLIARELSLWVVETNVRARRFYEAQGMRADGGAQRHVLAPGVSLAEVRYRLELTP